MEVFVYGTLKQGNALHGVMQQIGARKIGEDVVSYAKMFHMGAYPAVMVNEVFGESEKVVGEVYEVDADGLGAIDQVEGHPSLFVRVRARTDSSQDVFMYVGNRVFHGRSLADYTTREIPEGCWNERYSDHWV